MIIIALFIFSVLGIAVVLGGLMLDTCKDLQNDIDKIRKAGL